MHKDACERPVDRASSPFVAKSLRTALSSAGPSAGASAGVLSSIAPYILTRLVLVSVQFLSCMLTALASKLSDAF